MVDGDVVYIGQSLTLKNRLLSHVGKLWGNEPEAAILYADSEIQQYQLHEIENDLIAGYFATMERPPKYQFRNLGK